MPSAVSSCQYRQADTTTVTFHAEGLRIDRWTFEVGHSGTPSMYFTLRPSLAPPVGLCCGGYAGRIRGSGWHRPCEVGSVCKPACNSDQVKVGRRLTASATAGDDANAPAKAKAHTDRRNTLIPPSTERTRTSAVSTADEFSGCQAMGGRWGALKEGGGARAAGSSGTQVADSFGSSGPCAGGPRATCEVARRLSGSELRRQDPHAHTHPSCCIARPACQIFCMCLILSPLKNITYT